MLPKSLLITAFTLGLRFLLTASLQKAKLSEFFLYKIRLKNYHIYRMSFVCRIASLSRQREKHYLLYVEKWFYGGINRA